MRLGTARLSLRPKKRCENVDAAIMQSIGSGEVKVRVELIRALGAVACESNLPALMRRLVKPKEADARLELGSDDATRAWLGGKLVHSNYTHRGMSPRQDIAKIRLKEGWNEFMLKVVDHEGGWSFCCRVRAPDGSALDGLWFEAR